MFSFVILESSNSVSVRVKAAKFLACLFILSSIVIACLVGLSATVDSKPPIKIDCGCVSCECCREGGCCCNTGKCCLETECTCDDGCECCVISECFCK